MVVYRRASGLTAADRRTIAEGRANFNRLREERAAAGEAPFRATTPLSEPVPAPDGKAALLTLTITGDGESDTLLDPVNALRDEVSDPGGGLEAKVTGPGGFAADQIKVFESINGTLFAAAFSLVFVLLILIYRSPIFLFIPLIAVVLRRAQRARRRLRPQRAGGDDQRAVVLDPLRPRARRGHGLRAAARLAVSGGAAQARGQARRARAGACGPPARRSSPPAAR